MVLSVFPDLLSYPLFGIFLIRFVLGFVFLHLGYTIIVKLSAEQNWIRLVGMITLLVGVCLTLGLFTQVAALVAAILSLIAVIIKVSRPGPALAQGVSYYLLLLAIALALLTLGPGTFAIDLPL